VNERGAVAIDHERRGDGAGRHFTLSHGLHTEMCAPARLTNTHARETLSGNDRRVTHAANKSRSDCAPQIVLWSMSRPIMAYQLMLRRAFLTTGLPWRISFDHGTVFYDNTSPSPFPTRLHLWLLALGIEVRFTRKRCPTDHAKIERTHQTMTLQALLGQYWPDQTALWAGLDARRTIRPEWEIEMLDVQGMFQYLGKCRWFRRVKSNGRIAIGGYEYYLSTGLRGTVVAIAERDRRLVAEPGIVIVLQIPEMLMSVNDLHRIHRRPSALYTQSRRATSSLGLPQRQP
jgi:hypothetical protein